MNNEIVYGSLGYLEQQGKSIAESFLSIDAIIMIDISMSMEAADCQNGQTRYQTACDELRRLQRQIPGKVAVIEWADGHAFMPGGVPSPPYGCTNLTGVLQFVKQADDCGIRFVLISDGEPDNPYSALDEAHTFRSKIDTIFCGPENGPGADFLRRLASLTGGQYANNTTRGIVELAQTVTQLLTA